MFRSLSLILLSLPVLTSPIQKAFFMDTGKEEMRNEEKKSRADEVFEPWMRYDKSCFQVLRKKTFKNLKEAEEYLRCLLKQRDMLVGDFYGINITAFRYVNIFDRLNYIRYKIMKVDKEIKETKLKICELRKRSDDLAKSSPKK